MTDLLIVPVTWENDLSVAQLNMSDMHDALTHD